MVSVGDDSVSRKLTKSCDRELPCERWMERDGDKEGGREGEV